MQKAFILLLAAAVASAQFAPLALSPYGPQAAPVAPLSAWQLDQIAQQAGATPFDIASAIAQAQQQPYLTVQIADPVGLEPIVLQQLAQQATAAQQQTGQNVFQLAQQASILQAQAQAGLVQQPFGLNPYAQVPLQQPFGLNPYAQAPVFQQQPYNPYVQSPFAQTPYIQSPYVQSPYVQSPYAQSPFIQSLYAQSPFVQSPYVQAPLIQAPYIQQAPIVQAAYIQAPYAQSIYGLNSYLQSSFGRVNRRLSGLFGPQQRFGRQQFNRPQGRFVQSRFGRAFY